MATTETLWIVNTRTCNLDCLYCYQGSHKWKWQEKKGLLKMMQPEILDKALPWASEWAQSGLNICWYGGEPLLNFVLMKDAMPKWQAEFDRKGKDLRWSVTTNGTMLSQEVREFLDEHKAGILLSLDGPPEQHNKSRVYYGGGPTYQDIPIEDILKWRPKIEIAWQIDPRWPAEPSQLDNMIGCGFRRINFNVNWNIEWGPEQRIKLEMFMRHVARYCIQSRRGVLVVNGEKIEGFNSNWMGKLDEALIKVSKPLVPCGTGLHMLGLTPEGWLYPSQEMAFTALEPNRAPGTDLYYRVGDISKDPVIDQERLAVVSSIKNDQMIVPEPFSCDNCIANPISFGGCHCRYVGQEGSDPANRYGVLPGWCQSMQSGLTGLLQGAMIEKYVGLKLSKRPEEGARRPHPPHGAKSRRTEQRVQSSWDTERQDFLSPYVEGSFRGKIGKGEI